MSELWQVCALKVCLVPAGILGGPYPGRRGGWCSV